jgi:hypothetical protein
MDGARRWVLVWVVVGTAYPAISALGKPVHFESLKLELIRRHITCTSCHVADDDAALVAYGKKIAAMGDDESVPQRVAILENELSRTASADARKRAAGRKDVDGDGILNWVEILAGTSPSEPDERNELHERIERVISCTLCHTSVSDFPVPGREQAPHNAYGNALADAGERKVKRNRKRSKPRDDDSAAIPILPRIKSTRGKDADRDKAKNWIEIQLFRHPADASDTPSSEDIAKVKEAKRKSGKRSSGFGEDHDPRKRKSRRR